MANRNASLNLIPKIAFLFVAGLMLIQFFYNRSLWADEAMLALNIVEKSYRDLLHPLDDHQVAPILFLWVEKTVRIIFGSSEMALRFFPLLCSLGSLMLIYRLAAIIFNNKIIALATMVLLGLSPSFIYYSSEVKQYAVDVFVMLAVYYCAIELLQTGSVVANPLSFKKDDAVAITVQPAKIRCVVLAVVGGLSVFLSSVSVIPLITVGSLLVCKGRRRRWLAKGFIVPLLAWAVCFGINYLLFIHNHPYTSFMQNYWRDSFMPVNSFSELFGRWAPKKISQLFYELLPSGPWKRFYIVTILLYLFGFIQLFRKKKYRLMYLFVAPVVIHLLLSAMKLYPFDLRLTLYLAPLLVMVIAFGTYQCAMLLFEKQLAQNIFIAAMLILISLGISREFPIKREEFRPVLEQVSQHLQAGDAVYVYYNAVPVFRYYREAGLISFDSAKIIYGKTRTNEETHYLDDVDGLQGWVWFVFSHIYPRNKSAAMERSMLNQLLRNGVESQGIISYGSSAYLFNMK